MSAKASHSAIGSEKKQRLSVAMCTYNGSQYLKEQLKSISSQTCLPYELVVCDDRSSDNTMEILRAFSSKAPFPVHIHLNERNLGLTKNFEKAIRLCKGDVVVLSDQDDVWHAEKLRRMDEVLSESPSVAAVFSDAEVVDEQLSPLGYSMWQAFKFGESLQNQFSNGGALEVLLRSNFASGNTMAFRAQYKEAVLPIVANTDHDSWIALLIAAVGDVALIRERLIKYRQHSNQVVPERCGEDEINRVMPRWGRSYQLSRKAFYKTEAETNKKLGERAKELGHAFPIHERAIELFEEKKNFFLVRAHMPDARLLRLPMIIKLLLKAQYHEYANGIRTAAKDLIF